MNVNLATYPSRGTLLDDILMKSNPRALKSSPRVAQRDLLGSLGVIFGAFGSVLGALGTVLGPSWERLGWLLEPFWSHVGVFLGFLRHLESVSEVILQTLKSLQKPWKVLQKWRFREAEIYEK